MAEPATQAQEAAPAAEAPKQPSESERMQAAMEKGAKVAAEKRGEDEEPKPKEDPAAEEKPKDEEEAEATEAEGEADEEKPAEEKPEPKTARAKEWASINRVKQAQATKDRELRRQESELTKTRADLQVIQQELVNLNKLRTESPRKFLEALAAGSGGMRKIFEEALQEEKRTPEEEEKLALKRELEDLKAWRKEQEEANDRWRKEQEEKRKADEIRAWHSDNYKRTQDVISDLAKEGAYPNVAALVKTTYGLRQLSGDVYNRILTTWNDGKGHERNIPDVLDDVEAELAREAGEAPPEAPPARTNGAVKPANSEAKPKRTPPTLTSAQASARASAGRELKGEERLRHFSSLLRTRPE